MDAKRFVHFFLVSLVSVNLNATTTYRPNKFFELTSRNWLTKNTTDFFTEINRNQAKNLASVPCEYQELVQKIKNELAITQEIAVCEMDPIVANFVKLIFGFTPEADSSPGLLQLNIEKLDQLPRAEKQFVLYR